MYNDACACVHEQQLQQQQQVAGTKLEKAELLEMTVAYVCRVQDDVSRQLALGFASCMREVDAFLAQTGTGSELDTQLRAHLVRRLSRCRRRLGSAILRDQQTARARHDDDRPSSSLSNSSTSGSGLLPRRLCFDEARQTRPALRDINDNTRYEQLISGDFYRRPAALGSATENVDLQLCVAEQRQTDMTTVTVDSHISSTTSTSAAQLHDDAASERLLTGAAAAVSDDNVSVVDYSGKDEPVWRPW